MLSKVISGGQTGADRAGLIAAKKANITTGGYIPKGFKTELGSEVHLGTLYGLAELGTTYPQRTLANVQSGDATLIFFLGPLERGSALTAKYCEQRDKPYLAMNLDNYCDNTKGFYATEVLEFLKNVPHLKVLNVAGNRESVAPGITDMVTELLSIVFIRYFNETS